MIIVGAGPTGLALALALARHGIPTRLLDDGAEQPTVRPVRTCVLPPDTARWAQLDGARELAVTWSAWRTTHRHRTVDHTEFAVGTAPVQLPQHALETALRNAAAQEELVRLTTGCRLTGLEQDGRGITAHTEGGDVRRWHGSHLVGCDGARSTVRKLLRIPFPGRTAVERYAVAALRAPLPRPDEGALHCALPGLARSEIGEVMVRPLTADQWRLDWPLPPNGGLVTPDTMLERIDTTLAAWHDGAVPSYELLDTGVLVCHQRLARRWRSGRAFLAGDAAHLLGALGTQQVAEGLRDAENLAWKLAAACHDNDGELLLDSYEAERRPAVGVRLRAVDQALPVVRGRGGVTARLIRGRSGGRLALLTDSQRGHGALGAPSVYADSPLSPRPDHMAGTDTAPGGQVVDVPVIALDGTRGQLRDRLGGPLLLVLTAPGARVWDVRHWLSAGLMPELARTVHRLPLPAELLVTEEYPGAVAHTVLIIRPDGHMAAALPSTAQHLLAGCAHALLGATPEDPASPAKRPA